VLPLQQFAAQAGVRPGIGTAIGINLGLPLFAFALAVWRPRYWSAWVGGVLLALGFFLGAMLRVQPQFWLWTPTLALQVSHPILLGAAVGCGVVGMAGVVLRRSLRPENPAMPV